MRPGAAVLVVLLLGQAAAAETAIDFDGQVRLVRLGDIDGDGRREVLVLCAQPGYDPAEPDVSTRRDELRPFAWNGSSLVAMARVALPSPSSGVAALDVDGDARPEVLAVTRRGVEVVAEAGPSLLLADGFLHADRSALELDLTPDLDGDGHPDLAVPTTRGVLYRLWREGAPIMTGPGMELPVKAVTLGSSAPSIIARLAREGAPPAVTFVRHLPWVGDLDGDGLRDAALPLSGKLSRFEGLRLYMGSTETPPFAPADRPITLTIPAGEVLTGTEGMAFGDLDGDDIQELAISTYDLEDFGFSKTQRLRVFGFGKGYVPRNEPLVDVATKANLWEPMRLSLADLDGDGRGDLVALHMGGLRSTSFTVERYEPRDGGGFRMREQSFKIERDEQVDRTMIVPPVDLDGDGTADFVVVGKTVVYVLRGAPSGRDPFETRPIATLRIAGADKILTVVVDDPVRGPASLYVVARLDNGRNRLIRVGSATSARDDH